jgi:hypothetical protein
MIIFWFSKLKIDIILAGINRYKIRKCTLHRLAWQCPAPTYSAAAVSSLTGSD